MTNFKEIAEKCLAGKIKGFFILRDGTAIHSSHLHRESKGMYIYKLHDSTYTEHGNVYFHVNSKKDIIKFKKKEEELEEKRKIEINIPEDKIAIIEETSEKITITWKEKELTYDDIANHIWEEGTQIGVLTSTVVNDNTNKFSKKVEVLRKLINIRNYFGKPNLHDTGWFIMSVWPEFNRFGACKSIEHSKCPETVIFKEKEHAEQAIKMLGDELKYLFELW